jgi:transcriptional regulator with XRE-family HTH domain
MPATQTRTPPLPVPKVNQETAAVTLVPQTLDAAWRSYATAGASAVIADSSAYWNTYAADAGLLALDIGRIQQSMLPLTGAQGEPYFAGNPPAEVAGPEPSNIATGLQEHYTRLLGVSHRRFNSVDPIFVSSILGDATRRALEVNLGPLGMYRAARQAARRSRASILDELRQRLDRTRAQLTKRSPQELARQLTDELGLGQLAVARSLGVTPTAVRKWQRGEQARPEHRDRLARLAALTSVLTDLGIHDPAGWLDIAVSDESALTPLDLFSAGKSDLVTLLAAGLADPRETLDAFDPAWRQTTAPDTEYRIVELADGSRSAIPGRRGD